MIKTITPFPGVTVRCVQDSRFKQACMSLQLVRPMCREEAALNALFPAVLLRGSAEHPDLQAITVRLDALYGASVGALVRRVGDYQTTGLSCGFIQDAYAFHGEQVLGPMVEFVEELLLRPVLENGHFRASYVESEKKNLTATIDAERNDKRTYAANQMFRQMCREDSFGIPRLGEREDVARITPESLYAHYRRVLQTSPVEVFYVGAAEPDAVVRALTPMLSRLAGNCPGLPPQTAYRRSEAGDYTETMDVAQGKLCMGFFTPITNRAPEFVSMQLLNLIFGAGMTSKLFMNVREKLSLCYDIGSHYYGTKGILTVSAGIDCHRKMQARQEILNQLDACRRGDISPAELESAKQAMRSGLQSVHDSPGAMESFYSGSALNGTNRGLEEYRAAVDAATAEQVAEAARSVQLHTVYFLEGVGQ